MIKNNLSLWLVLLSIMFAPTLFAEPLSNKEVLENSIRDISVSNIQGGAIVTKLTLDRAIDASLTGISLNNPERIYFDFFDVSNGLDKNTQEIGEGDLRSINIVQAGNRTRLVMNLSRLMIYETHIDRNVILIKLNAITEHQAIGVSDELSHAAGFASQDAISAEKFPIFPSKDTVDNTEDFSALASLFDDEESEKAQFSRSSGLRGFSQFELANAYSGSEHFSKARLRTQLSHRGQLNPHIKWKISARFDYDFIHDLSDFYPKSVRRDQRAEIFIRENYLDISAGDFDFRVGRQHIIWGEMIGLFFADVVSAKDMREFVLPDFDILRIPQWAIRAEYSKNDFHADLIWIPFASIDESGKPGAEFFPFSLPVAASFKREDRSGHNPANSNYGLRLSQLIDGWDISAFYYHSIDAAPTFYLVSGPTEPLVFQARHDMIDQFGVTFAKDLGSTVLKGELIYTDGRRFNVSRFNQADGLVKQDTLDYVLGLDVNFITDTRLNLQFFQRVYFSHDPDNFQDEFESGASVFISRELRKNLDAQVLLIHSLNRSDWMLRPRLTWQFITNLHLVFGADIFGGERTGLFGRFDNNDRIYTETRFSF